jgi:hypothetical protein
LAEIIELIKDVNYSIEGKVGIIVIIFIAKLKVFL